MADTDPENEISDVERPKDRPLDPCHGEAVPHLIGPRAEADKNHHPKKSHERIKPARRVAQRPQKIVIDFPFRFKIHFSIASANKLPSAACRDLPTISFRETSERAEIPRSPDHSNPQTRAPMSGMIVHRLA